MNWWNKYSKIPNNDISFNEIVAFFVFECPSTIRHKEKGGIKYDNVSARNKSFRDRGISKHFLLTILAKIRKPLIKNNGFILLDSSVSVEDRTKLICEESCLKDDQFELIVFQKRSDMPDTEAIFYYIRNSFAHGSFDIVVSGNSKVYRLESKRNGSVKARMRLKESTLLYYKKIAKMNINELKESRKKKQKD